MTRLRRDEVLMLTATVALTWFAFTHQVRQSDLQVFLAAARAVLHGATPYTAPTDPHLWGGSAFVYPWLSAFLFVPLALLPSTAALLTAHVVNAAAVIGGCRLLGVRSTP